MKRLGVILPLLITLLATLSVVRDSLAESQKKDSQFVGVFKVTRSDFVTKGPTQEELSVVHAHVEYWQDLIKRGVCQLAGHTLNKDESAFGLVVIRADSEAAAKKLAEDDPMVRAGIITVTVFPFEGLTGRKEQATLTQSPADLEEMTLDYLKGLGRQQLERVVVAVVEPGEQY
ncbi:MAG TPA: YciI family protein [Pyrinomonadaceae bacterium]|nr:YciI family protein [Pyrinomonadaceae bacterium]